MEMEEKNGLVVYQVILTMMVYHYHLVILLHYEPIGCIDEHSIGIRSRLAFMKPKESLISSLPRPRTAPLTYLHRNLSEIGYDKDYCYHHHHPVDYVKGGSFFDYKNCNNKDDNQQYNKDKHNQHNLDRGHRHHDEGGNQLTGNNRRNHHLDNGNQLDNQQKKDRNNNHRYRREKDHHNHHLKSSPLS